MTTSVHPQPGPLAGPDRRPHADKNKSPADLAFEASLADIRLNSSAKLVASIYQSHCRSDDNDCGFLGRKRVARIAGWDKVLDKGVARVGRALAMLIKCGHMAIKAPPDFWRWHAAIGGPKLGIKVARPSGNPRRFAIARWKRPDAAPSDWETPAAIPEVVDGAHIPAGEIDKCAPDSRAPSTFGKELTAPITENSSNFEPGVGTGERRNVTGRPLGEAGTTEAGPLASPTGLLALDFTEDDVARWLVELDSRLPWQRKNALRLLDQAGRVPPE